MMEESQQPEPQPEQAQVNLCRDLIVSSSIPDAQVEGEFLTPTADEDDDLSQGDQTED